MSPPDPSREPTPGGAPGAGQQDHRTNDDQQHDSRDEIRIRADLRRRLAVLPADVRVDVQRAWSGRPLASLTGSQLYRLGHLIRLAERAAAAEIVAGRMIEEAS